jgi:methoxymalonate biosynthesis protein
MTDQASRPVAVLGAGVMGTGIAALVLGCGIPVTLIDIDEAKLAEAEASVPRQLRLGQLMGQLPPGARTAGMTTTTEIGRVADAQAVIEAVTERLEAKSAALASATAAVDPGTLVISNTSAIPIDELAGFTAHPEDVVGIHFMNPPYLIRTVELIAGPRSAPTAIKQAEELLSVLGCAPVLVGDGPGFVINRILQRAINEAALIVESGIATAEAVDALFTGCLGHRAGPLATGDLIGLDNVVDSLTVLLERTGDDGYRPCELLLDKVAAGEWGRKSGRGFFNYEGAR